MPRTVLFSFSCLLHYERRAYAASVHNKCVPFGSLSLWSASRNFAPQRKKESYTRALIALPVPRLIDIPPSRLQNVNLIRSLWRFRMRLLAAHSPPAAPRSANDEIRLMHIVICILTRSCDLKYRQGMRHNIFIASRKPNFQI